MAKDIHIEGEISTNWGNIISDLAAAKDATIYVNSGGGSVTEGFAMADAIRRHSATHTVDLIGTGVVASIATMVLLAGKKGHRKMTANSFMMIHNPTVQVGGDASVLRGYADTLESMTAKIVQCYFDVIVSNSKLINNSETETKAQIAKWMDAETWFTAQQALEAGLIDAVVEASDYDTATIKNYCKAYTIPQSILNDMEHTKEERTLFQKFLDFFRAEKAPISESNTTVENMTNEQMIEALVAAGYAVEKEPIEEEKVMTEEEMVAAIEATGMKVKKPEAMVEEKVEEKVEVKAENNIKNELQAMKEELARLKLANKAPKIENKAEPVKGETRREQAMNQFVAENKGKLEAIAQKIKGSL
jgi:ATP-dependent Clp endopeptidase proteolytic subunit ClpP